MLWIHGRHNFSRDIIHLRKFQDLKKITGFRLVMHQDTDWECKLFFFFFSVYLFGTFQKSVAIRSVAVSVKALQALSKACHLPFTALSSACGVLLCKDGVNAMQPPRDKYWKSINVVFFSPANHTREGCVQTTVLSIHCVLCSVYYAHNKLHFLPKFASMTNEQALMSFKTLK